MSRSPDAATRGAGGRHGSPWRAAGTVLVVLLALVGAGLVGASLNEAAPQRPPQPVAEAAPTDLSTPDSADLPMPGPAAYPSVAGLSRSEPTTITIPAIGVNADIMSLGLNPDGTVEVPPLEQAQFAGWYRPGPSPGEVGNAVVVGHVDSHVMGPAVFFRLGDLRPKDTISIRRADGSVARFSVDGVKSYPKVAFPTELVYGPSEQPSLRLVTCGGKFDEQKRSYVDNIIAFATLIP